MPRPKASSTIEPAFLSIPQVAVYLNRSPDMVRKLVAERRFPVTRVGREILIPKADLDSWLSSQTIPAMNA